MSRRHSPKRAPVLKGRGSNLRVEAAAEGSFAHACAALKLASLGRPVKKMIGGVTGWLDEGFTLVDGAR